MGEGQRRPVDLGQQTEVGREEHGGGHQVQQPFAPFSSSSSTTTTTTTQALHQQRGGRVHREGVREVGSTKRRVVVVVVWVVWVLVVLVVVVGEWGEGRFVVGWV